MQFRPSVFQSPICANTPQTFTESQSQEQPTATLEDLVPAKTRQLLRFVLVGGFNTCLGYTLYSLLLLTGLGVALSNLVGLCLSLAFGFSLQGRFVFGERSLSRLPIYIAVWIFIYVVHTVLLYAFISFGTSAHLAGAIAAPPIAILSYLVQKRFVFNCRQPGPQ